MGSYASLRFGDLNVTEFKSAIPLEALLMFAPDDLVTGGETPERSEDEDTYMLATTAGQARHRLDARGLTLDQCRRLFEELRSDRLHLFEPGSWPGRIVTNPLDFDGYLDALRTALGDTAGRALTYGRAVHVLVEGTPVDHECLFDSDSTMYFPDAVDLVFYRSLLETVPDEAPVVLDLSDLVGGSYIGAEQLPHLFDYYTELMSRRMDLDTKMYGFVVEEDPRIRARLRDRVSRLDEGRFIRHVVHPLLEKMGFEHVRRVVFHGPGEFGADVLPFRSVTPLGTLEYYAVQAKVSRIHGTSSKPGNAAELLSQAAQAFAITFVDDLDNERKRIDKFVIATNKEITPSARSFIQERLEGDRKLVFLELDRLVELVKQYRLVQYLAFSDLD